MRCSRSYSDGCKVVADSPHKYDDGGPVNAQGHKSPGFIDTIQHWLGTDEGDKQHVSPGLRVDPNHPERGARTPMQIADEES